MQRLVGAELASLGRRFLTEFEVAALSPDIRAALARLIDVEVTTRTRSGPNALRINGYL